MAFFYSFLPRGLVSDGGLRVGEESGDCFFFSAVRTDERAATAAALCDPWAAAEGLEAEGLDPEDELNAFDKAAKASALCLGPPWLEPLDLSWSWDSIWTLANECHTSWPYSTTPGTGGKTGYNDNNNNKASTLSNKKGFNNNLECTFNNITNYPRELREITKHKELLQLIHPEKEKSKNKNWKSIKWINITHVLANSWQNYLNRMSVQII